MAEASTSKPAKTKAPKAEKAPDAEPKDRRSRGLLEADVLRVVNDFIAGKVDLGENGTLTPHRISTVMVASDSLDSKPSPGAISNVLTKWVEIGFMLAHLKPFAFKSLTAAGEREGLESLKAKAAEKKAKAKAAAKKATAAAE